MSDASGADKQSTVAFEKKSKAPNRPALAQQPPTPAWPPVSSKKASGTNPATPPVTPAPPPSQTAVRPPAAPPGPPAPQGPGTSGGSSLPLSSLASPSQPANPTPAGDKFQFSDAVNRARETVAEAAGRGPRRARLQLKKVDPWSVMKLSFLLSVVATLYPAWRASRTHPVEALRYE